MVLGGEHDVARAGAREQARPRLRAPVARRVAELLGEALVRKVAPEGRVVVRARRALGKRERVPVPLRVRIARERLLPALLRELVQRRRRSAPTPAPSTDPSARRSRASRRRTSVGSACSSRDAFVGAYGGTPRSYTREVACYAARHFLLKEIRREVLRLARSESPPGAHVHAREGHHDPRGAGRHPGGRESQAALHRQESRGPDARARARQRL